MNENIANKEILLYLKRIEKKLNKIEADVSELKTGISELKPDVSVLKYGQKRIELRLELLAEIMGSPRDKNS
jgi:regulator of replication initiation timing